MSGTIKRRITVEIRMLAEITFPEGGPGSAPSSSLSARQGSEIHKRYQSREIPGYESEVSLGKTFESEHILLDLSGRADGLYFDEGICHEGICHIEEIKTVRTLPDSPIAAHLAQLKLYGWLFALDNELSSVRLDLIYCTRSAEDERIFSDDYSFDTLNEECSFWTAAYLDWCDRNEEHRIGLAKRLDALSFPFNEFRKGQYDLSKAVYRSVRDKKILFAEAPTGTGKTAAVLFPALKALAGGFTDRLFYLTAKNAGAAAAEKTVGIFNEAGAGVRWITITAKSRICFTNGDESGRPQCSPESCPYAADYYARRRGALETLFTDKDFSRERIETTARRFTLCPFELSLDLSLFCDLIICDYNHVFDLQSKLKRFFDFGRTNHTLLIDEAHNMVDRVRSMFTAEIGKRQIMTLKKGSYPPLKKALDGLNKAFIALKKDYGAAENICEEMMPDDLVKAAQKCRRKIDLLLDEGAPLSEPEVQFYFQLIGFTAIAERYGSAYRSVIKTSRTGTIVSLRCIDPAGEIEAVLKDQRSAVFFSATLSPMEYYRELLAPSLDSWVISLESPFAPDNCLHFLRSDVSTRYKDRETNIPAYAALVKAVMDAVEGNIVVFSPSFRFQSDLVEALGMESGEENEVDTETAIQRSSFTSSEREEFIGRFHTSRNLKAFCVCGGSFSESIDLPGDRLIGVIIFGVGLPQINFDNDIVKDFFQHKCGRGYQFAYMYPGFNKVLQSAGRVIRTEDDRGFVFLIDDRYRNSDYRRLLPAHWRIRRSADMTASLNEIRRLFGKPVIPARGFHKSDK